MLIDKKATGSGYCHALTVQRQLDGDPARCAFLQRSGLHKVGKHYFCTPHFRELVREKSRARDDRRR